MENASKLFPAHATWPRDLTTLIELAPSVATRETLKKGGASMPGELANYWRWREVRFDSGWERKLLLTYTARPDVADVQEQPASFEYIGLDGKRHEHTPDLLIIYRNGFRELGVVKPLMKALELNLPAEVRNMAPQISRDRADAIRLMTEYSSTPQQIDAAQLFNMSLRRIQEPLADTVYRHLRQVGPRSIRQICDELGDRRGSYWATIWLLAKHRLVRDEATFLTMDTEVAVPTAH